MNTRRATTAVMVTQLWRWFSDARRFEDATYNATVAQEKKLLSIIRAHRDTEYGKRFGFGSIRNIGDYQRNVPINTYENLSPYIDRMTAGEQNVLTAESPLMFATTSGTTGKAKFIPVTTSSLAEVNHAVQTHTWRVLEDHPEAGAGQFMVTSSRDVEGRTSAGIPYGAMSGFVVKRQPSLVRSRFALPYEIALITNIELKYYLTLRMALNAPLTAISSLNPSSIVLLCEKLQQYREELIRDVRNGTANALGPLPDWLDRVVSARLAPNPRRADELAALVRNSGELRPLEIWPDLATVLCWKGGTMPLYFRQLRRWFPNLPIRDRGYLASEGCGSIPLTDAGSAGALAVTTSFFEFIPVEARDQANPPVLTAAELQPNRDYYILFTTSAGLYRYDINDVIRVVDFYHDVPLIEFVRKGRGMTSMTGEKLAEQQVTAAMMATVEGTEWEDAIRHFAAVPQFDSPPRYAFYLELKQDLSDEQLRGLAGQIDHALCTENVEYETKRESLRLGPAVLKIVAPGTFDAYKQARVSAGAPEAQVKIPHLTPDREFGKQFTVVRETD
ncbi:MAG: GH3 auxin-responsive promoter family protein [Chloroflexi bacterium]|nr:GH3 auxin-responsive promoter family protein [Chloroflexota bacterium]